MLMKHNKLTVKRRLRSSEESGRVGDSLFLKKYIFIDFSYFINNTKHNTAAQT